MFESEISGIAVPIFDQLWRADNYPVNGIKRTDNQTQAAQPVIIESKKYLQNYVDRHGQIRLMPALMKDPLPLEAIYIPVKLLDDTRMRCFNLPDERGKAHQKAGLRDFRVGDDKHQHEIGIVHQKRCLMVLGSPGVGKTTFLKKLGLEALKVSGQLQPESIPVFIKLKAIKDKTFDLKQLIVKELKSLGFPAADLINAMLDQGELIVLLDGLDQAPTHLFNQLKDHIVSFVEQYDQTRFIVSCRTAAYQARLRHFTEVAIAEFDDEQIEQFIQRWFSAELGQQAETAQSYWERLNQDEHTAAMGLAQTPLLLTFLCLLVYDHRLSLPNVRSILYKRVLDILLSEWEAQRRLARDRTYNGLTPSLEKLLLAELAHHSFVKDQRFFSQANLIEHIAGFLADTHNPPKYLDGEKVLTAIEVQQGILVKQTADDYSFFHLTLQEYLTASYIVERQLVDKLVTGHLTDPRWREVFLLVAGLMGGGVHQLLVAIDQQARTDVARHPKLCDLINWTDAITEGVSKNYTPITKRATVLAIALAITNASVSGISAIASALAIAIDNTGAITGAIAGARAITHSISRAIDFAFSSAITLDTAAAIAIDSAAAIDNAIDSMNTLIKGQFFTLEKFDQFPVQLSQMKQAIPGEEASYEQWLKWANQLESAWLDALHLDEEMVTFSRTEAEAIQNYLYANDLLVGCKHSAVRISRKVWEDLEERLLKLDQQGPVNTKSLFR